MSLTGLRGGRSGSNGGAPPPLANSVTPRAIAFKQVVETPTPRAARQFINDEQSVDELSASKNENFPQATPPPSSNNAVKGIDDIEREEDEAIIDGIFEVYAVPIPSPPNTNNANNTLPPSRTTTMQSTLLSPRQMGVPIEVLNRIIRNLSPTRAAKREKKKMEKEKQRRKAMLLSAKHPPATAASAGNGEEGGGGDSKNLNSSSPSAHHQTVGAAKSDSSSSSDYTSSSSSVSSDDEGGETETSGAHKSDPKMVLVANDNEIEAELAFRSKFGKITKQPPPSPMVPYTANNSVVASTLITVNSALADVNNKASAAVDKSFRRVNVVTPQQQQATRQSANSNAHHHHHRGSKKKRKGKGGRLSLSDETVSGNGNDNDNNSEARVDEDDDDEDEEDQPFRNHAFITRGELRRILLAKSDAVRANNSKWITTKRLQGYGNIATYLNQDGQQLHQPLPGCSNTTGDVYYFKQDDHNNSNNAKGNNGGGGGGVFMRLARIDDLKLNELNDEAEFERLKIQLRGEGGEGGGGPLFAPLPNSSSVGSGGGGDATVFGKDEDEHRLFNVPTISPLDRIIRNKRKQQKAMRNKDNTNNNANTAPTLFASSVLLNPQQQSPRFSSVAANSNWNISKRNTMSGGRVSKTIPVNNNNNNINNYSSSEDDYDDYYYDDYHYFENNNRNGFGGGGSIALGIAGLATVGGGNGGAFATSLNVNNNSMGRGGGGGGGLTSNGTSIRGTTPNNSIVPPPHHASNQSSNLSHMHQLYHHHNQQQQPSSAAAQSQMLLTSMAMTETEQHLLQLSHQLQQVQIPTLSRASHKVLVEEEKRRQRERRDRRRYYERKIEQYRAQQQQDSNGNNTRRPSIGDVASLFGIRNFKDIASDGKQKKKHGDDDDDEEEDYDYDAEEDEAAKYRNKLLLRTSRRHKQQKLLKNSSAYNNFASSSPRKQQQQGGDGDDEKDDDGERDKREEEGGGGNEEHYHYQRHTVNPSHETIGGISASILTELFSKNASSRERSVDDVIKAIQKEESFSHGWEDQRRKPGTTIMFVGDSRLPRKAQHGFMLPEIDHHSSKNKTPTRRRDGSSQQQNKNKRSSSPTTNPHSLKPSSLLQENGADDKRKRKKFNKDASNVYVTPISQRLPQWKQAWKMLSDHHHQHNQQQGMVGLGTTPKFQISTTIRYRNMKGSGLRNLAEEKPYHLSPMQRAECQDKAREAMMERKREEEHGSNGSSPLSNIAFKALSTLTLWKDAEAVIHQQFEERYNNHSPAYASASSSPHHRHVMTNQSSFSPPLRQHQASSPLPPLASSSLSAQQQQHNQNINASGGGHGDVVGNTNYNTTSSSYATIPVKYDSTAYARARYVTHQQQQQQQQRETRAAK